MLSSVTEAEMYLRELSGKGLNVTFKKADQVIASFTIPAQITITNSPEDIRSILSSPINQEQQAPGPSGLFHHTQTPNQQATGEAGHTTTDEPADHMEIDTPTRLRGRESTDADQDNCTIS